MQIINIKKGDSIFLIQKGTPFNIEAQSKIHSTIKETVGEEIGVAVISKEIFDVVVFNKK